MRSGVQSLHRSVRDDPAVAAALWEQGVITHDDEGNQRSTAEVVRALSAALQTLGDTQAAERQEVGPGSACDGGAAQSGVRGAG